MLNAVLIVACVVVAVLYLARRHARLKREREQ